MARQEQPKENLMRDAKALVERVELQVEGMEEHVVAGFRRDGAASFFFGEDPVFHFNTEGELRRAFCDGLLIKAEKGELSSLDRQRTDTEVQLIRHDFDENEKSEFVARTRELLVSLKNAIDQRRFTVVAEVSIGSDVLQRVHSFLAADEAEIRVAQRPNL